MKVKLYSIPPHQGLDVRFELKASGWNQKNRAKIDEAFSENVVCEAHLELSGDDVFLSGSAKTSVDALCFRCGGPCRHPVDIQLHLTCTPKKKRGFGKKSMKSHPDRGADIHQESEEGLVYFDHEELDLDEIMREQVLLSLPMRYLCREACRGLCPRCGENLNAGDAAEADHTCKKAPN